MALAEPYTMEEFMAMTGHRKSHARALVSAPARAGSGGAVGSRRNSAANLRLLGIDPGTRRVGWGLVERNGATGALKLLDCGCITPRADMDLKLRLRDIFAELEEVIKKGKPDFAALEETFAGVNMKSAIAMGQGRGIALLSLARAGLEVLELSPRSIKQAVTGSGASGKTHVAAMVAAQLSLKKPPRPADITDALAAAIALARRVEAGPLFCG